MELDKCGNHVVERGEDCDGQPGCNQECHLICRPTQDRDEPELTCPSGWGCDVDLHVCHAGTGKFSPQQLDATGTRLYSADFDHDGRSDLLSVAPSSDDLSELLFFDAQGATAREVTLPVAYSAAIDEVTGDKRPDLFLGASEVNAFSPAASRNLWPLISATRTVEPWSHLLAADVDCDGLRDFVLLEGSQLLKVQPNGNDELLAKLKYSAEDLGSKLGSEDDVSALRHLTPVGRFAYGLGQACEMVAIPEPGKEHIDVYGPPGGLVGPLQLLSSVTVKNPGFDRAFFVDLNDDGHDDLLLTTSMGNEVSYGVGDGTFHSDAGQLPEPFLDQADNKTSGYRGNYGDHLLAAGAEPNQSPNLVPDGPYSDAKVGHLTLGGELDAVAIGPTGRVDVLRGLLQSPLPIPGSNLDTIEDIADIDGDGLGDVLFTAQRKPNELASTVSVLFSPVMNGSAARQLAFPGPIRELAAGYVADAGGGFDTNADIGVLYRGNDDGLRLGFLLGGSDQLLRSRVGADQTGERVVRRAPVLGHFDEKNTLELAVVKEVYGGRSKQRVELFSVDGQGSKLIDSADLDFDLDENAPIEVAAIDRNGDGVDDLYLATPGQLIRFRRFSGHFAGEPVDSGSWSPLTQLDANGDGRPDLTTFVQTEPEGGKVSVLLGAGDVHELEVDASDCSYIVDRTFIQADDDADLELLVLCVDGNAVGIAGDVDLPPSIGANLLLYDVDWSNNTLSRKGTAQSAGPAAGFAVGDFNGDGVQDFALGAALGEPQLWLGVKRGDEGQ